MDLIWGANFQADTAWLEAMAGRIKTEFAHGLWVATEGQMFLSSQTLKNGASGADVKFMTRDTDLLPGGAAGVCEHSYHSPDWFMELPGKAAVDNFLHEFCHGHFQKFGEEYTCDVCVMGQYQLGRNPQRLHYCNADDCKVIDSHPSIADCWGQKLLAKYSNWTNTGRDPGTPPSCAVTINE
jgi:hypothetical protein